MPRERNAQSFGSDIREHLARVEAANEGALDRVADEMFRVVTTDGLIYVGGTGHSIALMLEGFYRAGGLACVQPLYHPSLLPLHGGQDSTLYEHTAGVAKLLVARYAPTDGDIAFIVSNSGVNVVPVELADELRARHTPVVAIVSLAHLHEAKARAGHKLDTAADYILDTQVPYGDAAYRAEGQSPTAGLSSITGVYLWTLLLARVADRAAAKGIELPIWTSSNVEGGAERNAVLFDAYRKRVPLL
ncbi:MAG TPA: sugar isomerase domain-containing protein [Actinomycetota bacterium]|nr:sugar isomerase domain-containing protein [Actinomycetota bacterium]